MMDCPHPKDQARIDANVARWAEHQARGESVIRAARIFPIEDHYYEAQGGPGGYQPQAFTPQANHHDNSPGLQAANAARQNQPAEN